MRDPFEEHSCPMCGRFVGYNLLLTCNTCCTLGCQFKMEDGLDPDPIEARREKFNKTYKQAISRRVGRKKLSNN